MSSIFLLDLCTNLFDLLFRSILFGLPFIVVQASSPVGYWAKRAEVDNGQPTTNEHIIAERILKRGGPITHHDVNAVLANSGISITAEELERLKAIPFTLYKLPLFGPSLLDFKLLYPKLRKNNGQGKWGIYMYINMITGGICTGSSINLGERLPNYWKDFGPGHLRSIYDSIRTFGLHNFTLRVYDLPKDMQEQRLLLAWEQYYILANPNSDLNDLKVAGGSPGGMKFAEFNRLKLRQSIHLYRDNVLLYSFDSRVEGETSFCNLLGVSQPHKTQSMRSGNLLYGVFLVSGTLLEDAVDGRLPIEEVQTLVKAARSLAKTEQAEVSRVKKAVSLTNIHNKSVHTFKSVGKATNWLNTQGLGKTVWKTDLVKSVRTGVILQGIYQVKYIE